MTDYRRSDLPGGYYFFTVVTHDRRAILTEPAAQSQNRAAPAAANANGASGSGASGSTPSVTSMIGAAIWITYISMQ